MNIEREVEKKIQKRNKFSYVKYAYWIIVLLIAIYVFNKYFTTISKNENLFDSIMGSLIGPYVILFIAFVIYKITKSIFTYMPIKEYKKHIYLFLKNDKVNVSLIDSKLIQKYKNLFRKLRSVKKGNGYSFEDFLEIKYKEKIYHFFESNVSYGSGKNKHSIHYSVIIFPEKYKENINFHITSKNSEFQTTSNIKMNKRTKEVLENVLKIVTEKFFKPYMVPIFKLLYLPLTIVLEKTGEFNKQKELQKKEKGNVKIVTPVMLISYIAYSYGLFILFRYIDSKLEYLLGFDPFMYLFSIPIVLFVYGIFIYSFFSKNKAKVKYKDVDLDNEEFNKYFDIHTENEIESYKFLSPTNLEKLLMLEKNGNISLEVRNGNIVLILARRNLFEITDDIKSIEQLKDKNEEELKSLIELINILKF